MAVGSVQLIEELNAADGHNKGVAEAVVGRVVRIRAVRNGDPADDDIVVVRIRGVCRTIRVQRQRFPLEKPAFAQIRRDRRDHRFLLVARAVIKETLDITVVLPHEWKVIGLHRIKSLSSPHPAVYAITRVRRAKGRGGRIVGRRDRRNDAGGVVAISAHALVQGPGSIHDTGLSEALRHIGNLNGRVGAGISAPQKSDNGGGG